MYNIFSYLRILTTTDIKSSYTKDELRTLINFNGIMSIKITWKIFHSY